MRQCGCFWWSAVLISALGVGCSDKHRAASDAGISTDGSVTDPDSGYLVADTDGDGVADLIERGPGDNPADSDQDGVSDYLDDDDDGDGVPTSAELGLDSDNDGTPNYVDADDDNDGTPTKTELEAAGGSDVDTDQDGTPDYLDDDRDVPKPPEMVPMCAQTSAQADLRQKPVDIVFVIDNSSSMKSEIKAVQASINTDFARVIGLSGIDYRVIMLADFGHYNVALGDDATHSICIGGDLNPGQACPDNGLESDVSLPAYMQPPANSARFFHYDPDGPAHDKGTSVGSLNSWCRTLEWYKKPTAQAAEGWGQWLRKDASKVFVEITDDRVQCTVALPGTNFAANDDPIDASNAGMIAGELQAKQFDRALRGLSPEQFGTEAARNYVFHSIISMPAKSGAMSDTPYEANEAAAATSNCAPGGEHPGRAYEQLSMLTGGLRFPICAADAAAAMQNTSGFTAVFQRIAQGVIAGNKVACDFAVPQAPAGQTLDRDTVEVVYSKAGANPISFRRVQDVDACAGQSGSFYFQNDKIQLCSDTCTRVQADDEAKVDVRFGCTLPPREEPPPLPPQPPAGPQ